MYIVTLMFRMHAPTSSKIACTHASKCLCSNTTLLKFTESSQRLTWTFANGITFFGSFRGGGSCYHKYYCSSCTKSIKCKVVSTKMDFITIPPKTSTRLWSISTVNALGFKIVTHCDSVVSLSASSRVIRAFSWLLTIIS